MLLACAACTSNEPTDPASLPTATFGPITSVDHYVALGDSYSSGPGINPADNSTDICLRSEKNYPKLVAKALDADLDDVSCAGATTDSVLDPVPTRTGVLPAQVDALDDDTDLVTLTIGGNDESVFGGLYSVCTGLATTADLTCADVVNQALPTQLKKVRVNVTETLRTIRRDAPKAKVVLIGYFGLVPTSGQTCAAIGIPEADLSTALTGEQLIDGTLRSAAEKAGVGYLSMLQASVGHDVCAGKSAWVNGITPSKDDGVELHPNAAGMAGLSSVLTDYLARGDAANNAAE